MTEIDTVRRIVARHIHAAAGEVLAAEGEEATLRAAGGADALGRLHAALAAAGCDLDPELSALGEADLLRELPPGC